MARYLDVLGRSIVVPDPDAAASLSASYRAVCTNISDALNQLTALGSAGAWGLWQGAAADAFARKLGRLPGQLDQAWQSFNTVSLALSDYATGLSPLVASLVSVANQADEAESTLVAVRAARDQVIRQGLDPRTTGWETRLDEAEYAVDQLARRLSSLLNDLDTMAAECVRRIGQAQQEGIENSPVTAFERYIVQDTADPVLHAAAKVGLFAAALGYDVLLKPFIELPGALLRWAEHPTFHNLGLALNDLAGALGAVALVLLVIAAILPGTDVVAGPALLAYAAALGAGSKIADGAALGSDVIAASTHEQGATWGDVEDPVIDLGVQGVSESIADPAKPALKAAQSFGEGVVTELTGRVLRDDAVEHVFELTVPDLLYDPAEPILVLPPPPGLRPADGSASSVLRLIGDGLRGSPAAVSVHHVTFSLDQLAGVP